MKFCTKCGLENDDDSEFCLSCGKELITENETQSEQIYQPQNEDIQNIVNPNESLSTDPVLHQVKSMVLSPLFLIAAICFSIASIIQVIVLFVSTLETTTLTQYGLTGNRIASTISDIVTMSPIFLIVAGLWNIYVTSKNPKSRSTAGFTLIKASSIVYLVSLCIGAFFFTLLAFIRIVTSSLNMSSNSKNIYFIPAVIVVTMIVLILTAMIIYNYKIIATINTIKRSLITSVPSDNVSSYVAVINYITVFFSIVGIIISTVLLNFPIGNELLSVVPYPFQSIFKNTSNTYLWTNIESLFSITALLMFSKLIFTYKKNMRVLIMSQQANLL